MSAGADVGEAVCSVRAGLCRSTVVVQIEIHSPAVQIGFVAIVTTIRVGIFKELAGQSHEVKVAKVATTDVCAGVERGTVTAAIWSRPHPPGLLLLGDGVVSRRDDKGICPVGFCCISLLVIAAEYNRPAGQPRLAGIPLAIPVQVVVLCPADLRFVIGDVNVELIGNQTEVVCRSIDGDRTCSVSDRVVDGAHEETGKLLTRGNHHGNRLSAVRVSCRPHFQLGRITGADRDADFIVE